MNRAAFYAALRRRGSGVFGTSLSQQQVNGIEGILNAFASHGDGRGKTLAYALATAHHETGGKMVPVREGFARTDAQARARVNRLAEKRGPNSAVAKYARPQPPYGHVYYGRGQVQLTWKRNYERSSADAGVDLVRYPDKVLDPVIGARILIRGLLDGRWNGTGFGIAHYLPDRGNDDLKGARRTVNITDKWQQIGGYYKAFLSAIEEAGGVLERDIGPELVEAVDKELSATQLRREPPVSGKSITSQKPKPSPAARKSGLASILAAILRIFTRRRK